jgi:hypothetical protein
MGSRVSVGAERPPFADLRMHEAFHGANAFEVSPPSRIRATLRRKRNSVRAPVFRSILEDDNFVGDHVDWSSVQQPFPQLLTRALRSTRDHKGAAGSLAPAMAGVGAAVTSADGLSCFSG